MKIRALEYFIAMAESRSINEAAQKLYIAQPSLTKCLQSLEEELGVSLFRRSQSGITLTEEGERILPEARQVVELYQGWKALGRKEALGELDLYCHASLSGFLITDILLEFRERYPELLTHYVVTMAPEEYISRDRTRPAVVMTMCDPTWKAHYSEIQGNPPLTLAHGAWQCLVSRESTLAGKEAVSFQELREHYFVLPMMSTAQATSIADIIADITAVVSARKILWAESVSNVIDMVRRHPEGYAISYYPALRRYAGVDKGELVHIPFRDYDADRDLCLFYAQKAYARHPILAELVDTVREKAEEFLSDTEDKA